ncbi:MAG: hypothetical protein AB1488_06725 [Nitrospirota bacterium]
MITPSEEDYIKNYAYVPEHITGYVIAVSQGEPLLLGDYLCYDRKGYLIFVGYPLNKPFEEKEMNKILDTAIERFKPDHIALIAPAFSISREIYYRSESDCYYKLDLSKLHVHQKLRNMIKRASRELYIERKQELRNEHIQLISEFLNTHKVDEATQYIFERIPEYVSSVPTAEVFSARDKAGRLVAFDVAEFSAKDYAFYMFNFMSQHGSVPGVSDLLLYEVIRTAQEQRKSFINLGLGINEGVTFFKKKWGGVPFLHYEFCLYHPKYKRRLKSLYEKL